MTHSLLLATLALSGLISAAAQDAPADWADDPVWYDGLVEKATYDASRVVYGKPRAYEAVFLTNKEQHEVETYTKATPESGETVEVWKHNQIEVIPTPNYDYKYTTTSHLTTGGLGLTRLDCGEQEFCGTSFKQYLKAGEGVWDYFQFSYMPGAGRVTARVEAGGAGGGGPVVPFNALPLWLRDFDFGKMGTTTFRLLPDQKSNRLTPHEPVGALVRYREATEDGHRLELVVEGELVGTFEMADDRRHVMLGYESADGEQTYRLKAVERVDYWSTNGK